MANDPLSLLTLFTNFLCMAISLWFAIYLLSRSHANHLSFRAIVALIAIAFFYNNAFGSLLNPATDSGSLRALSMLIGLIAAHDLTHYLLEPQQRKKLYWEARGIVMLGVVMIVLIYSAPVGKPCDPRYICPSNLIFPWTVIDVYIVLVYSAILYNLWQIKQTESWFRSVAFYLAVLLAASAVGYSAIETIVPLILPRFLPNLMVLFSLSLLIYSVAHDRTLVTQRSSAYDLPVTMLTIAIIVAAYILAGWQMEIQPTDILLLSILAIFTHSGYDFVREFLDRLFHREERRVMRELRVLSKEQNADSPQQYVRRALTILCHNLMASSGIVAIHQGDQYTVVASLHSLPVGTQFPPKEVTLEGITEPTNAMFGDLAWLAPAFIGSRQIAVVGIGLRKDRVPYSEDDLFWLEDIVEEIGWMIHLYTRQGPQAGLESWEQLVESELELPVPIRPGGLAPAFTYKPDSQAVRCIEEGFRHLHDYEDLGSSPLVEIFGIQGGDCIERGKQVQQKLYLVLEKLRPAGQLPPEPLPSEWYAYTILHDAYVEEKQSREIMAKLYIGEGTYYRMRRQALRGITRALFEMGAVT